VTNEIKQKEFCRLTGLTRKALLIYEQRNILIPSRIDIETGYRFYSKKEVQRGAKIAVLRAMDFSVADIENIIDSKVSVKSLFDQKSQALVRQRETIDHGLAFLELSGSGHPFSEKCHESKLSLYQIATMEGRGTVRDLAVHLKLLSRYIRQHGAFELGPTGSYFYVDSTVNDIHFKVFVPISGEWLTQPNGFQIENFGAPTFHYIRHFGNYELLPSTYDSLRKELTGKNIPLSGEYMEIYRIPPTSLSGSNSTMLITDVGVPQWL